MNDVEKVKAALAEAGYPKVGVATIDGVVAQTPAAVPVFMFWKAKAIAGVAEWCWPCRSQMPARMWPPYPEPCGHDIDPFCHEEDAA